MEKRLAWLTLARSNQIRPEGEDWATWLMLAGRGFGKTRSGAEDVAWEGITHEGWRVAVAAPTFGDARDTCIEGESGLLAILPDQFIRSWNRGHGVLTLNNGTSFRCFSAEEPNRFRGPQHHLLWADELAAWPYEDAWDQAMFGLRLGHNPRSIVTTTPRPTKLIKYLVKRSLEIGDVRLTTGSTFDNAANLPSKTLDRLRERYAGTRLGEQELYARILDDIIGALWTYALLGECRQVEFPDNLSRVVVAVDPAVTKGKTSDETGIVVCGAKQKMGFVLEDGTLSGTPNEWGSKVVALYRKYHADMVVAEVNNGGDMVSHVIHSIDPNIKVKQVRASRGKIPRAEPISGLYEQRRVKHVGSFRYLEDQMCSYTPMSESEGAHSPDRMDAMVWGLTELLVTNALPDLSPPIALPLVTPYSV